MSLPAALLLVALIAVLICIVVGYLIAAAVRAADIPDDPWDECSDLQGSPRTSGVRLPPAEFLQIHNGDNNR